MKNSFLLFILTSLFLFQSACSVQKRKNNQDGVVKRAYHNVTAHYNGYFNAEVLVEESIETLKNQNQDNYGKILPVFAYVAADNPGAVAGSLDEAIKKVTVVVNLHPESNWSDDSYLLAGKAQYLKKDYESAEETLRYMLKEFSPEAIAERERAGVKRTASQMEKAKPSAKSKKKNKKQREKARKKKRKEAKKRAQQRKKERERRRKQGKKTKDKKVKSSKEGVTDEEIPQTLDPNAPPSTAKEEEIKPDKYFMKHRPAFQEGQLWMARTYIERNAYTEASRLIDQLEDDPRTFKEIRKELQPVKAHFYLKQEKYDEAIEPLKKAIELGGDREDRARYSYILAQLHQRKGNAKAAEIAFAAAKKFSQQYDMEFSAELNIIRSNWLAGVTSSEDTDKLLHKMTRDVKNYEYRDQIYYFLANIALKDHNKEDAIAHLQSSLQFSEGNQTQQAESYLQLADLYFEDARFVLAKNYFDSTAAVLPQTDERYTRVSEYANNLTDIAKNLTLIETQDSLLAISNMSEDEKRTIAYQIKQDQEAQRIANLKENASASLKNKKASRSTAASNYWAYNDKARKKGLKDFKRNWGNRPLRDNWRVVTEDEFMDDDDTNLAQVDLNRALTGDEINNLLRDVPQTEDEIREAEGSIEKAMLSLGTLYRDRLQDNERAIDILEEMEKRFPRSKMKDEMYYYLYLAHLDDSPSKAQVYYDKLSNEFPDSRYTLALTDPSFLSKSRAQEKALMEYYDETYLAFSKGNYQKADQRIQAADEKFGKGNKLAARFALLGAMTLGNVKSEAAYRGALREVVAKYPNTPEEVRAKEILRLIGKGGTTDDKNKNQSALAGMDNSKFTLSPNKLHYFIVVLKDGAAISLNDAKNSISDYNRENHKLLKLRISPISLGKSPMVVLRRFKSQEKAMQYYDSVFKNPAGFLPEGVEYDLFPISQQNYRSVLKSKSLGGYAEFFNDNYLN